MTVQLILNISLICSWIFLPACSKVSTTKFREVAVKNSSVWQLQYLQNNPEIARLLAKFDKGDLCSELKTLNGAVTHLDLGNYLLSNGYKCSVRPMNFTPDRADKRYLTRNGEPTLDFNDKNVVWQEFWYKKYCSLRVKLNGQPGVRPHPHYVKAILISPEKDSFDNEAFKITTHGKAVPKSPKVFEDMGYDLKTSKYDQNMVDQLMKDAHQDLLEPSEQSSCQFK